MIKAFTDIEQSKRLAEILPIESADMCYPNVKITFNDDGTETKEYFGLPIFPNNYYDLPCWSLVALLEVIKGTKLLFYTEDTPHRWCASVRKQESGEPAAVCYMGNPVDACELLISKLHKMGLL